MALPMDLSVYERVDLKSTDQELNLPKLTSLLDLLPPIFSNGAPELILGETPIQSS